MKTIIAGSRSITDYQVVERAIENAIITGINITEIVSGTCYGPDKLGEQYASIHNIPIKQFPANWKLFGKSAGFIRNEQMAQYANASILIWDGISKGTKHVYTMSKQYNLLCYIITLS